MTSALGDCSWRQVLANPWPLDGRAAAIQSAALEHRDCPGPQWPSNETLQGEIPIWSTTDTAQWVACFRGMENERGDALFRDPWAQRLAGAKGAAMAAQLGYAGQIGRAIAVRTATIDGLIDRLLREEGLDLVLNLAAGMDTRPWRLPLPATLKWIDVDAAEILAAKNSSMAADRPRCLYRTVAADVTRPESRSAVLDEAAREGKRILVLTEGLLVYLSPEQVSALAQDLRRYGACQWWLLDLVGPKALGALERVWGALLGPGQATFQFAPADANQFFAASGWREALFLSSREEARRLGRPMPLPWLVRALLWLSTASHREEFRRLSGVALLVPRD